MKAGKLGTTQIQELAMFFAKELVLRKYYEQFNPNNPQKFVELFFESLDALLEELDSQNGSREEGILFAVLDVD